MLALDCSLNADLHCHSTLSDGTLTPEELAQRAKDTGVELWALTDHDNVEGVERAAVAAHDLGLPFITGVEISVSFLRESVHIVGLGMDVKNAALLAGLQEIRKGRVQRALDIAQALEKIGIKRAYEGALSYAGNPESISRTHFSRFLVSEGVCRDNAEVFKKYLKEGKQGYVPHKWASLSECLQWIRGAGGLAVVAHPGRYKLLNATKEHLLLSEFGVLGGKGIEVVTGSHSPEDAIKYAEVAKTYGLWASRGSDFHSPDESRIDLGKLPLLSDSLVPVWAHLADRIRY